MAVVLAAYICAGIKIYSSKEIRLDQSFWWIKPITETLTRNPTEGLVEGGSPVRREMTQQSESPDETQRPTIHLTPRNTKVIGTYNVRTMKQTGKAAIVAIEIRKYTKQG